MNGMLENCWEDKTVLLQTEVLYNIIINYHYLYIEESQMNYSRLAI